MKTKKYIDSKDLPEFSKAIEYLKEGFYEENEYQYQQRMGYDMAINEIKPLLQREKKF